MSFRNMFSKNNFDPSSSDSDSELPYGSVSVLKNAKIATTANIQIEDVSVNLRTIIPSQSQEKISDRQERKCIIPLNRIHELSKLDQNVKALLVELPTDDNLKIRYNNIVRKGCATSRELCNKIEQDLNQIISDFNKIKSIYNEEKLEKRNALKF